MVGVRVAPDNNDIVVWKLDDSGAPFVNSSTSSSAPSHAISDLGTISGTVILQQPSPFSASGTNSCVQFTGNQNASPRNTINGANNFLPQPPITISCWLLIRAYDTSSLTQHGLAKQVTTGVWSGSTFASIDFAQNERYNGSGIANTSRFDFSFTTNSSNSTGNANTAADNTITLNLWHHLGVTYDGTNVLSYINGNQVGAAVTNPTGNIYYSGTPGPWFIGAIPAGSGSPEECNMAYCDVRIANIIRPQSYFQNIYVNGALNQNVIALTKYYKMRAFDLGCSRVTPVFWIDTQVNYNNAPSPPCGGPLGPIEVMEVFPVING
jgi:Concanavalin A-like lectin/glucanases superfamily